LKFSSTGLDLLKNLEGFRSRPYADAGGKMTVGYGHLIIPGDGVALGDIIGPVKGAELLQSDVQKAVSKVNQLVPNNVSQNQFDALVIFAYNIGVSAFEGSTLLKLLNNGDAVGAANQFLRWDMADGQHLIGLRNRRIAERTLFLRED
jgi:lysozyme